jgi:ABC-type sugar transport system ATPase subunit
LNVLIGLEMLNKITILNSKVYGKATIDLQDIDSLQLVGPNNIGKSTLIYALNFLFVIDGQKMSFSGGRKGNKETIDHYLPSLNQSYIIFEISKNATYCVMVKRNAEFDIEYYKIDSSYSDSFFFADEEGKQRLLKFDEVKENFEKSSIALTLFKNKSEVFSTIYQRGRKNDAAVWLEDSVKSDGLSNNFSKIYRYLINSKLITNKTLKESLIIADNRENEIVNFSQKNKKELSDLLRINDEIKNVKSISSDFTQFREMVNLYYGKIDIIGGLKFAFNRQYQTALPELDESILNRETDIRKLVNEINEVLEPQKQELNRKIGQKEFEIQSDFKLAGDKKVILDDIKTFEDAAFLKQQSSNLDKQRKEIEARITTIESQGLSSLQLQGKVLKLDRDVKSLNEQIKNYDNLLIHNISDNADDRKLLNAVFSSQISSLPASQIKKKISKSNKKLLKIFDGEIDLSKGITIAPFKPVEELKDELKEIKS